jgi:hypothetical protein
MNTMIIENGHTLVSESGYPQISVEEFKMTVFGKKWKNVPCVDKSGIPLTYCPLYLFDKRGQQFFYALMTTYELDIEPSWHFDIHIGFPEYGYLLKQPINYTEFTSIKKPMLPDAGKESFIRYGETAAWHPERRYTFRECAEAFWNLDENNPRKTRLV